MSSRFLQGDGYPVLKRYNSSNVLQETINMPYVADSANSYIRQKFIPYPDDDIRIHELLGGDVEEDSAIAYKVEITIKYSSISASDLKEIYDCLLTAQRTSNYLKLRPRDDYNSGAADYRVLYAGGFKIQSKNQWQHDIELTFITSSAIGVPDFAIPPVAPL